jgi:hypothetical protein
VKNIMMTIAGPGTDKNGEVIDAQLIFSSGKIITLTTDEWIEFNQKLRLIEYGGRLKEQEDTQRNKEMGVVK